jgi:hypothetical protein
VSAALVPFRDLLTGETTYRPDPDADPLAVQRAELALVIAQQAHALATGKVIGPEHAAVRRLLANVETLAAWTPDDRT